MEPVQAAALAGSVAPHSLSMIGLFMMADWVVKSVMIMLLLASVWCWAIIINKRVTFRGVFKRSSKFEEAFWASSSLEDLYARIGQQPKDPKAAVFCSAMREWQHSNTASAASKKDASLKISLPQRIDRVMRVTIAREMEYLERSMPWLASVGSVSPFIGLFGTVWGIMNSFSAIASMKNTSLAVVAPGIAEALFATALGLIAAIPAVLAYNWLSGDLERFNGQLESFADEMNAILSRRLEDK